MPRMADQFTQDPSLRQRIGEELRAAVVAGEMVVGEVYSVPSLAEQFGVSITPVREAMLDLVGEGLLEPVRNKGFRVRELSDAELDDITEARQLLEPPVMAALAGRLNPAAIAELRRLSQAVANHARRGQIVEYVLADLALHRRLFELHGNEALTEIVMRLRTQSRLFGLEQLAAQGRLEASAGEHDELLDAIAAGDGKRAAATMRRHLGHVRSDWAGR